MTYEDALNEIHDRLRFGNKLTLTRIKELLHLLEDPHKSLRIIHVAGTNGKGSVSKYIYNALRENGFKVGLYTSPYIVDFRERIECDGTWITQEELVAFTERVFNAVHLMESTGSDAPTEFEIVVAMAFLYYKEKGCDYVVLEVGLGGRGDATNVIAKPLVSIITSISFDHMEYLGNTLAEIAEEKAGIIKKSCPIVYDVQDKTAAQTIQKKAKQMNSRAFAVQSLAKNISVFEPSLDGSRFSVSILGQEYSNVFTPLAGLHQVDNAITALTALNVLQTEHDIRLDSEKIVQGLAKTRHVARFEKIWDDPLMIIDGAHNAEGMKAFCNSVKPFIEKKKTLFILGILKDKEFIKMLETVLSLRVDIAVSEPENSRKASAKELGAVVESLGGKAEILGDAQHAIAYAKDNFGNYECILFAGSLYFVSAIREGFIGREEQA
jgi:dihydrofolate synthase/folylpolyglutamate synthase